MRNHTHIKKNKKWFHEQMHARRTQRLMSNHIIIRKTKAEEKTQGVQYKMFRLVSEVTFSPFGSLSSRYTIKNMHIFSYI